MYHIYYLLGYVLLKNIFLLTIEKDFMLKEWKAFEFFLKYAIN